MGTHVPHALAPIPKAKAAAANWLLEHHRMRGAAWTLWRRACAGGAANQCLLRKRVLRRAITGRVVVRHADRVMTTLPHCAPDCSRAYASRASESG
jgi:hypothetical protein